MNKNRTLLIILIIASIFAAYYLGTQNAPSGDPVRSASFTVQPLSRSVVTAAPKSRTIVQQYILNRNTKKFHKPSCSSVKQMKESNKIVTTKSRDEIIADGYEPCGRCHP